MKTLIASIIIVVLVILIASCSLQKSTSTVVVLYKDVTDNLLAKPNINEIMSLYAFDNVDNGGLFYLTKITDVSFNETAKAKIPEQNHWFSNEFDRNKEISNFKNEILKILTHAYIDSSGRGNSSIYLPIARALNELSTNKMQKRVMLIYSDLMENTIEMSFYDKYKMYLLKTNPDSIAKYFDDQLPLKNLKGIDIYIVYQPVGINQDEQFKIVSGFYLRMFESEGANVQIVANMN